MTTLQITNSDVFSNSYPWPAGFDTEFLGHYGDNGGDPDGNAWLPSQEVSPHTPEGQYLIDQGDARATDVQYANDQAIARLGGIQLAEDWQESDDLIDALKSVAEENSYGWAHYGAYGADDSTWVFQPLV